MKSFAQIDTDSGGNYVKMLSAIASLSGLYSDSTVPLIHYRAAENIFCHSFNALNLSRSDTAFDAKYETMGIGIKTFVCINNYSIEKIAEFNSLASELKKYEGIELASKLSFFRNKRIELAKRLYNITNAVYHIIARKHGELFLFETDYDLIDLSALRLTEKKESSLHFTDGRNRYSFNYSKSTLFRMFSIPLNAWRIPVSIHQDPYVLLKTLTSISGQESKNTELQKGKDYIILPLYSTRNRQKHVFEKSGLNQWNAGGRHRDSGELYIPIPKHVRQQYPDFFPPRNIEFQLHIPSGEIFTAKVCQDGAKALMSNPNNALSNWLLRTVLQLKERELATINKMNELGFDSVALYKKGEQNYFIDKGASGSYETFIESKKE